MPWVRIRISDRHLVSEDVKFEDFYTAVAKSQIPQITLSTDDVAYMDLLEISVARLTV